MYRNLIAIIDDGINNAVFDSSKIKCNIEITEGLDVVSNVNNEFYNHSTTCAMIINEYAPECVFASIKILNENAKGLVSQLIKSLEWCMENQVRLINLSLGTIYYRDFDSLRNTVNRAYSKNCIIIAACHNSNIVSYPAYLDNVIGVNCDHSKSLKNCEFIFHENPLDGIDITASGLELNFPEAKFYPANSFAAPRVTALVHNMISVNPGMSFFEIKKELYKKAKYTVQQVNQAYFNITRKIDWIENGFFISIETGNSSFSKIRLPKFIKKRASFNIKTFSDKVLQTVEEEINKSIDSIETIIVFIDHDLLFKEKDEKALISSMLKWNKNFIYLYDRSNLKSFPITISDKKVWFPFYKPGEIINQDNLADYKNEVPIILINDFTESKNISKLVQLINLIRNDGYHTVVLSEFTLSILFGFEYLPCSEYSENNENLYYYIKKITRAFDPDLLIIIANTKSPTIDYTRILKEDLEPDITFNLIQSQEYMGPGFKSFPGKVATINANRPNILRILHPDNMNTFSIYNTKRLYHYIINEFESAK
jgi:Subtilase family